MDGSVPASIKSNILSLSPYKLRFSSVGFKSVRKSRVTSKLNQLDAMLGATLRRLGTMPLYSPLTPSWRTMTRTASEMDLYW